MEYKCQPSHEKYKAQNAKRGGLDRRSYSMPRPVSTWMGLSADKPSRYVTSRLGQLSLPSLRGRKIKQQPSLAGVKAGSVRMCRVECGR